MLKILIPHFHSLDLFPNWKKKIHVKETVVQKPSFESGIIRMIDLYLKLNFYVLQEIKIQFI